jgi:predicted RecB family nuclease
MANDCFITPGIVAAYSVCARKAFFLLRGEEGESPHEYVVLTEAQASATLRAFFDSCKQSGLSVRHCKGAELTGKADVFAQVSLRADELQATVDALLPLKERVAKGESPYEPLLAIGRHSIAKEDKIRLAFTGHVVGNYFCSRPNTGIIVNAAGDRRRIQLRKLIASLKPAIDTLRTWKAAPATDPPPVLLNAHCPICPFKTKCIEQAKKDDSLTLLDRMTPQLMRKYHNKGIFTITQLSYQFKPRRQRKLRNVRPTGFNLELQALALRTGKIYIHQTPVVPHHPTELYLDIEGVPHHGSHYLIGIVVRSGDRSTSHSLWADSPADESRIFQEFLAIVNRCPSAPIYHYGSYEPKALLQMAKVAGVAVDRIIGRLVNVTTFIFGKVYFPARSNTLKELGRVLGATWTDPDASGLQSIIWRMHWQASKEAKLKEQLLRYNLEDCDALALLVSELRKIGQTSTVRSDVDFADTPKRNASPSGQQIHDALEGILKSAHARYRTHRISIRENQADIQPDRAGDEDGDSTNRQCYRRISPSKANTVIRVKRKLTCRFHGGKRLIPTNKIASHTIIDLLFTRSGCRKTYTRYEGRISYCPSCDDNYVPPVIRRFRGRVYGHCFRAWAVYQRIVLRLPYEVIVQSMYDLFREQIAISTIPEFVSRLAEYYVSSERKAIKRLLEGPFIHVDETRISIQGTHHYVWVLTDGRRVVFRLTETREATPIQQLLRNYQGVLISDFYAGYDACVCRQQKCLVHLIRDLNDDLWKSPFNSELEGFVAATRDLIAPIMADIDKFGLKKRHLQKHQHVVDRFFKNVIDGREYQCETTQTYQKRFLRYRESLFRFLHADGIPWNNNMAERASRHLAVQRKISGSFYKRVAKHYLLLLGIGQTCRFQGKSFLAFLLSKEKDVDGFREKRRPKVTKLIGKHSAGLADQ